MPLRTYDAFAKPIDGIRERSVSGGFITLLASITAALLFLSQIILYIQVDTRHSMHLAESVPSALFNKSPQNILSGHQIPLRVHVTFPHLPCKALDYSQDGNSESTGKFEHYHSAPYTFTKRVPTVIDYKKAAVSGFKDVNTARRQGCTLVGTIKVPRVGGTMSISVSPEAWRRATSILSFGVDLGKDQDMFHGKLPNVTHYVHDITFGDPFPPGSNPLKGVHHVMDNGSGVALANVAVKLVPTTYKRTIYSAKETYQASVSRHIVQPETLAAQRSTLLPGLMLTYDFTPLAVRHVESRENWLVFLSSLVGIVGGVFVTVGLVSGCLVNSAQAVAKKMD
ncbi:predicted protein [Thalassiosira pseudonana CCMP1335]|uniref:Endoplasmic reticulum vesicle transporter C-terminal domain-containing protein n=1 Tax=Thalassiosira pseudonana TaxID=35128 RepID=B8BZR7_THAPS|nr:predicted protein [Thalassiosira pseudonana CCMP1335]EED93395.1 predicted protein [Thalassiosira pseudonana CCMP1335]|eukprot:scaffold1477_cov188-Alexandrium_tamarense.AAC.34